MNYPLTIDAGAWSGGHIQGIAVDTAKGYIYYSFTTQFVKSDLEGHILGSVSGLVGHLGCLTFNPEDGRVYGSLEYKNDAIGRGILSMLGREPGTLQNGFYAAVFDVDKIDRMDMDAETDGIMTAVYLRDVVDDYEAVWDADGVRREHRMGCSGIDGISFGPEPGAPRNSARYLHVAYGIYGDTARTDNDHQVILQYDIADWDDLRRPLHQDAMHTSGPAACRNRYHVFTGNTTWGVQNLEYDPDTHTYIMCVYPGHKEQYPNRPLYMVDASVPAKRQPLAGVPGEEGLVLSLLEAGIPDAASDVWGWDFPYGSTGIAALGGGLFYVSREGKRDGLHTSSIGLYRRTGEAPMGFAAAE